MNLYIWEGDDVLTDYTDGMIVAVAENEEDAHKAILEECSYAEDSYPATPTRVIPFEMIKEPKAWVTWGGG
jgi:hypothetical protein